MSRERVSAQLKQLVIERAYACCEYCTSLARYSISPFAVDYIIPRSRGGKTVAGNWALVCQGCKGATYNKVTAVDPITTHSVPLFHPHQQAWRDHFAWNEPCTHLIGLTPIGRATIVALQLNRSELINTLSPCPGRRRSTPSRQPPSTTPARKYANGGRDALSTDLHRPSPQSSKWNASD